MIPVDVKKHCSFLVKDKLPTYSWFAVFLKYEHPMSNSFQSKNDEVWRGKKRMEFFETYPGEEHDSSR